MTPEEHKAICGFETPAEFAAFEKGYEACQETTWQWIEGWDGADNSQMGQLLKRKFKELQHKLNDGKQPERI